MGDEVVCGGSQDTSCLLPTFPPSATVVQPGTGGRIIGRKRPLLPKHVWAIPVRLDIAGRIRDRALFNLAIDSKRRGCDLIRLKGADVYAVGQA